MKRHEMKRLLQDDQHIMYQPVYTRRNLLCTESIANKNAYQPNANRPLSNSSYFMVNKYESVGIGSLYRRGTEART